MNLRDHITPEALNLLQAIAQHGSMAAAARAMGQVPSALSYRMRQLEGALDVLLVDRSHRQATLTPAGAELLREGQRVLQDLEAVANRVKRVATGWEPRLTLAVDGLISPTTLLELCEAFFALAPPTELTWRSETLSGTFEALAFGEADVAIGISMEASPPRADIRTLPLGDVPFVFAVAPHHALADAPEPLTDASIAQHRAVAVQDSATRGQGLTVGLLAGQRVLTVADMPTKLQAQLRGLGCGFLPLCLAQPYVDAGRLVVKATQRQPRVSRVGIAWRQAPKTQPGRALAWWLAQLESPATRRALLHAQSAQSAQQRAWSAAAGSAVGA